MAVNKGKVFIISAPSGAGKTTLTREILRRFPAFEFSVSATTRPPRNYEVDGQHYYFLSKEDFLRRRDQGAFLEWEEVYAGTYYGTLKSEVERILAKGNHPIFDVDVKGGLNIKAQYGDRAVAIFIQPPDPQTLLERLQKRGTESPEEIAKRYAKAQEELSYADQFDHVIVNDELQRATEELVLLIASYLTAA
jgi:guanylate kinase